MTFEVDTRKKKTEHLRQIQTGIMITESYFKLNIVLNGIFL